MEDLREEAEVEQVQGIQPIRLNTGGVSARQADSTCREQCRHCALVITSDNMGNFCRRRHDHYKVAPGDGASGGPTSTGSGPVRPQEKWSGRLEMPFVQH